MTVAIIVGFCVLLLILAFLVPRLSRPVQRGGDKTLSVGQRAGSKAAPGPLGRWWSKAFGWQRRAVSKSGNTGRRARRRSPM